MVILWLSKMSNNKYNKQYFQARDVLDLRIANAVKIFMHDHNLKTALDVGCGTGKLVQFLTDAGFSSIGCDVSKEALKIAKRKIKKSYFIKAPATKLPFKNNSFDLLTAISLIEHLTKKEVHMFLSETYRVIRPKGYIFLVTPNFNSPTRFLLGRKWFGYSDPTHITFFTPHLIGKLLQLHGFRDRKLWFKTNNRDTNILFPFLTDPKRLIIHLLFSTPFCFIRDSFWIAAQKHE